MPTNNKLKDVQQTNSYLNKEYVDDIIRKLERLNGKEIEYCWERIQLNNKLVWLNEM